MSDKSDTKILQVLGRQARQDRVVDLILAECGLILFEAKPPQPTSDVHDGAPVRLPMHDPPGEKACLGPRIDARRPAGRSGHLGRPSARLLCAPQPDLASEPMTSPHRATNYEFTCRWAALHCSRCFAAGWRIYWGGLDGAPNAGTSVRSIRTSAPSCGKDLHKVQRRIDIALPDLARKIVDQLHTIAVWIVNIEAVPHAVVCVDRTSLPSPEDKRADATTPHGSDK